MSRREFLEVLRGQLSGQMTQGELRLMCGIMRITFSLRSGTDEVNEDVLAELGDPRLIAKDFDRYR